MNNGEESDQNPHLPGSVNILLQSKNNENSTHSTIPA
jgi:hypothetical protein